MTRVCISKCTLKGYARSRATRVHSCPEHHHGEDNASGRNACAITPNLVNSAVYGGSFIAPHTLLHASTEEDANANWHLDSGEDIAEAMLNLKAEYIFEEDPDLDVGDIMARRRDRYRGFHSDDDDILDDSE